MHIFGVDITKTTRPLNPHVSQKQKAMILAASCGLILITTLLLTRGNPSSQSAFQTLKRPRKSHGSVQFAPSVARKNGSEVIWQIPTSPRAAIFLAHGCTIRAADFWDKSPGCPHCDGLPEERLFALEALERGFAVLTISSWGECWSFAEEMDVAVSIVDWWVRECKLENLPVVGLGASSGGYFVSALATRVKFSSVAVMIAEGVFDRIDITEAYPPALFVHMPKDRIRMQLVRTSMEALKEKGVDVKEVRCADFPVRPEFLAERIPGLSRSFAVGMLDVFRKKGFVDEKGYMKKDGRKTPWKEALEESKLLPKDFAWARHINEELNLAFAYHEFSSVKLEEIFEWFDSHMK